MNSFDNIAQQMMHMGITPSVQRIKIMEYLLRCACHPTADQIYRSLKTQGMSISKATVYNTLTLFSEKGLVRMLCIDENEIRYDIMTQDHGHFMCEKCGAIINFKAEPDKLVCDDLEGFKIIQKDVYFKGVCKGCLSNIKNND